MRPAEPTRQRLYRYRLFGVEVASDAPLGCLPAPAAGEASPGAAAQELELLMRGGDGLAPAPELAGLTPCYTSPFRDEAGNPALELFVLDDRDVLRFPTLGDFEVTRRGIVLRRHRPDPGRVAELRLLGPVFAVWLERQGLRVLHASAVAWRGRAVAFLGDRGQGKTRLAAELLQRGCGLLADDMLAVEAAGSGFMGRPAYPLMRMAPDLVRRFLPGAQQLERVHPRAGKLWVPIGAAGFGSFFGERLPLARIYLLERHDPGAGDEGPVVAASTPARAAIELVSHSFSPRLIAALGLEGSRLGALSRVAATGCVRRLSYPGGDRHLAAVCAAVLDDLSSH